MLEPDMGGDMPKKPEQDVPHPISVHSNFVTPNGLAQIERALAKFEAAHNAAISKDNKTAIELTARELTYWSTRKNTAILIPEISNPHQAHFGATVTVRRHDGRVETFRIVGEDEAEPSAKTISHLSPFARAVTGKSVGDHIEISGEDAQILAIG